MFSLDHHNSFLTTLKHRKTINNWIKPKKNWSKIYTLNLSARNKEHCSHKRKKNSTIPSVHKSKRKLWKRLERLIPTENRWRKKCDWSVCLSLVAGERQQKQYEIQRHRIQSVVSSPRPLRSAPLLCRSSVYFEKYYMLVLVWEETNKQPSEKITKKKQHNARALSGRAPNEWASE